MTLAQLKARLEAGLEAIEDALTLDHANAAAGAAHRAAETVLGEIRGILANQGDQTVLRSALTALAPFEIIATGAKTADTTSGNMTNTVAKGVVLLLAISAGAGTIADLKVYDGNDNLLATLTPAQAFGNEVATYAFVVCPNPVDFSTKLAFTAGAQGSIPRTWYVVVDHTDATSVTYTLDGFYLV